MCNFANGGQVTDCYSAVMVVTLGLDEIHVWILINFDGKKLLMLKLWMHHLLLYALPSINTISFCIKFWVVDNSFLVHICLF